MRGFYGSTVSLGKGEVGGSIPLSSIIEFLFKTAWFNLLIFGSRSTFHSLTRLSGTSPIMQSYRANPQKQPILQHLQKSIGYKPTERLASLRPSDWQGQESNSQPLKKSR
jgi:hypothetical protein